MAVVATPGEAMRHYFRQYPRSKPANAVDLILQKNPEWGRTVDRRKLLGEARTVKCRELKKLRASKKPQPEPLNGGFSGAHSDVHDYRWKCVVPEWLRDVIVQAATAGYGGWFDPKANNQRRQCNPVGTPHTLLLYPTTRLLLVWAGKRNLNAQEMLAFRDVVEGNLSLLANKFSATSEEKLTRLQDLLGLLTELGRRQTNHVSIDYPGIESAAHGKITVKQKGVALAINDGSNPGQIEVILSDSDAEKRLDKIEANMPKAIEDAVEKAYARVTEAQNRVLEQVVDRIADAFVKKMKEAFGEGSERTAVNPADGRRYS